MKPRLLRSVSVLVLVLSLSALSIHAESVALAQQDESLPPDYRELVRQALAEYSARNFAEARSLFSKAVDTFPSARALRGLGMAEFELRNYSDCADSLQRALASTVQPLEGTLRAETVRLLARARGFVAQLKVAVVPRAAIVVVDGVPVELGAQGNLVLEVGDHIVEFRAEGYSPERRVLKVKGGEHQALRINLPLSSSPAASSSSVTARVAGAPPPQAPGLDDEPRVLHPLAHRRVLFVPRLTLTFPTSFKHRTSITCGDQVSCDSSGTPTGIHRNAGVTIGTDVMVALRENFYVGMGLHVQLNQTKEQYNNGNKSEYGHTIWIPAVAELRIAAAHSVAVPLRAMLGLALLTGGDGLKTNEEALRASCATLPGDTCSVKATTGLGFVVGVGPGVVVQLKRAALRADLTLGYQWYRLSKLTSDQVNISLHDSGLLLGLSLGVEL